MGYAEVQHQRHRTARYLLEEKKVVVYYELIRKARAFESHFLQESELLKKKEKQVFLFF